MRKLRALLSVMVVALASCSSSPPACDGGACSTGIGCSSGGCVGTDLGTPPDLGLSAIDVGIEPGGAYAVLIEFGGPGEPTPSTVCAQLGAGFTVATSMMKIDPAKLEAATGFYFAAAYGTFNEANQLVSCDVQSGEGAIFGGGSVRVLGVKTAQPAPCAGFAQFYACSSPYVHCGAGPLLETTIADNDAVGVLCVK